MRVLVGITVLTLVQQVQPKKLPQNQTHDTQDAMDRVVDRLVQKLLHRALAAWALQLDDTTLVRTGRHSSPTFWGLPQHRRIRNTLAPHLKNFPRSISSRVPDFHGQSHFSHGGVAAKQPSREGRISVHGASNDAGSVAQDFENVIARLKVDVPEILHKEPDWNIFATNFKVIDHTGESLNGLIPAKALVKLLQKVREQFVLKDDIKVNPIIRSLDRDPCLAVEWKVQLSSAELQDSPLDIEAETVFHLNDKNQIDYMRIDNIQANGYNFRFWPNIGISDDLLTNLKKIKMWAREINDLSKIKDPEAVKLDPIDTEYKVDVEEPEKDKSMVVATWEKDLVLALRNAKDLVVKSWKQALGVGLVLFLLQALAGGLMSPKSDNMDMVAYNGQPKIEFSSTIVTSRSGMNGFPGEVKVQIQQGQNGQTTQRETQREMTQGEELRLRQILENARRADAQQFRDSDELRLRDIIENARRADAKLFRDFDVPGVIRSDDLARFFDDSQLPGDFKVLDDMLRREFDNPGNFRR